MGIIGRIFSLVFILTTYPGFTDCGDALSLNPSGDQVRILAQKPQEFFDAVVAKLMDSNESEGQIDAAFVAHYLLGKSDFISHPTDGTFLYYRVNFSWYRRDLKSIANKIHRAVARFG